jgi:hypothetical protein
MIWQQTLLPSRETCLVLKLAYTGVPTRIVANSFASVTLNTKVRDVPFSLAVAVAARASSAVMAQQGLTSVRPAGAMSAKAISAKLPILKIRFHCVFIPTPCSCSRSPMSRHGASIDVQTPFLLTTDGINACEYVETAINVRGERLCI